MFVKWRLKWKEKEREVESRMDNRLSLVRNNQVTKQISSAQCLWHCPSLYLDGIRTPTIHIPAYTHNHMVWFLYLLQVSFPLSLYLRIQLFRIPKVAFPVSFHALLCYLVCLPSGLLYIFCRFIFCHHTLVCKLQDVRDICQFCSLIHP